MLCPGSPCQPSLCQRSLGTCGLAQPLQPGRSAAMGAPRVRLLGSGSTQCPWGERDRPHAGPWHRARHVPAEPGPPWRGRVQIPPRWRRGEELRVGHGGQWERAWLPRLPSARRRPGTASWCCSWGAAPTAPGCARSGAGGVRRCGSSAPGCGARCWRGCGRRRAPRSGGSWSGCGCSSSPPWSSSCRTCARPTASAGSSPCRGAARPCCAPGWGPGEGGAPSSPRPRRAWRRRWSR